MRLAVVGHAPPLPGDALCLEQLLHGDAEEPREPGQ